ncbi:kinase-like protein [Ramaria rubella]|nr:kinase-like protein [Ramaria rubella]
MLVSDTPTSSVTSVDSVPPDASDANSSGSLYASVISSSSSSSSIVAPLPPIRSRAGSASSSGSPLRAGRPPPWLTRRFDQSSTAPSEYPVSMNPLSPSSAPSPAPAPPVVGRSRMASPEDFEFGEELGGGSWSTVVEAVHPPTSKVYAIKILNKAQLLKHKTTQSAVVEKNALALLSSEGHMGIVRLYSAFQDATSLYLVLSLAPNGDLRELVKKFGSFSLSCARYYAAQVVDTVQYIHGKGVLHRDLKPENILLDGEMRIKLTDFGSAYISQELDLSPRSSTFVGTAAYVSPELLSGPVKTTSRSSDIWAIGCIIYFLMVGQSPFLALTDYLSFRKIEALDYTFPENFDADAMDLVQRILVIQPSDRLGISPKSSPSDLREHPFFTRHTSMGSEAHPTSYINWGTLWTDPPVPIEHGLFKALPREQEDSNGISWDGFINQFSLLINENSTDSLGEGAGDVHDQPHPSPPPTISTHPIDEPPITTQDPLADHTQLSDQGSGSNPSADNDDSETASWCSILKPSETVRLVADVETRARYRFIQKAQHRTIILTTLPRLICVKAQDPPSARASTVSVTIKDEFTFLVSGRTASFRPKNEVVGVNTKGDSILNIETPEKTHSYTIHNKAKLNHWVNAIQELVSTHRDKN